MLDFVLFDESLSRRFGASVAEMGLRCEIDDDPMGGYVIRVLGEVDDEAADALEAHYEDLMTLQQDMVENADDDGGMTVMAVDVTLADGQERSIRLPAAFARRLHEHFDIDEIRELVTAIAQQALTPDTAPLCCRM
jgi:histone H3/H4